MKFKTILIGLLLFVFVFLVYALNESGFTWQNFFPQKNSSGVVSSVERVENINLDNLGVVDIQGRAVTQENVQNKIIIFNFWASWCAPCVKEVPSLIRFSKKLKDDVVVIAISGDSELGEVKAFLKSFPELQSENSFVVFDQSKQHLELFKVNKLPETYIFDRNQKFVKKVSGSIEWDTEDVLSFFSELKSNK